ncbi:lipoprotein insertase outer membrane protein LolB [Vibrio cyclitrophicus]|uniref:Outer-membrane lipoprotein LolB n=1 Tax=Vibrio cyclitrophicus ZF270 TaxID=1136176 RepID=A0AAN0N956_9VIBR|nr:lipoprotein insertase outer membrane protein LolB [Vibrio cyclitrophicus]OED98619.1 lipoprotein localization factor LolB [Vibrio cyclitrophicus ZF28]OEE07021.1 lipoprotein localization factor LolB [Vibrio cyclitrophicus ZF270]OEE14885.1 lipoprotein localization factor LolB [Vibrio cyclitrophicus ZF205]OEE25624.1 lipoprotein localization factor LolB [Vibrio cyclitrophicus ZF14]PMF60248.1 lipoprotein localization factor LolB [Vibrio cyclitrophicus]
MSKLRKITSLIFMTIIMVGCSSIPEQPTSVEWQSHQNRLLQIENYQASGKLAYISPEQRQSLNFIWKHSPTQSQLRLTTFLGQTALNLTIDSAGAKVVTYDDQVFTHASASVLVEQLTGLQIPIDHLPQWFLGTPDQADSYQLNSTNTLESLSKRVSNQLWTLSFDNYRNTELPNEQVPEDTDAIAELIPLPTRLSFKQDDSKINIVVSKWTLKK